VNLFNISKELSSLHMVLYWDFCVTSDFDISCFLSYIIATLDFCMVYIFSIWLYYVSLIDLCEEDISD